MTASEKAPMQSVMVCGKKKSATAVAHCKKGRGMIRVNGRPLTNLMPENIRVKVMEPLLVLGVNRFMNVDIRVRVKGGGSISQVYVEDESTKAELREMLIKHDRSLLVADPRRCEAKKFGGPSARTRRQKSYR